MILARQSFQHDQLGREMRELQGMEGKRIEGTAALEEGKQLPMAYESAITMESVKVLCRVNFHTQ